MVEILDIDMFPKGVKEKGTMDGKIFADSHDNEWLMKTADNGCFLRFQAEPESLTSEYRYNKGPDDRVHKSIAAISEVMYADFISLVIPDQVPQYNLYRNVPAVDDVGAPELLVATKIIPEFTTMTDKLLAEDMAGKSVEGFGSAYIGSVFFGDCDIGNIDNVGFVKTENGMQAKRIDFGYGGWFSGSNNSGRGDSVGGILKDFTVAGYEVGSDFHRNGIARTPFSASIIPEGEEKQVVLKIAEMDESAFSDIWESYKSVLRGQAEQLTDETTKDRILEVIDRDIPLEIILERQKSVQEALGKDEKDISHTDCTSIEDSLAMDRKLRLAKSAGENKQEGRSVNKDEGGKSQQEPLGGKGGGLGV